MLGGSDTCLGLRNDFASCAGIEQIGAGARCGELASCQFSGRDESIEFGCADQPACLQSGAAHLLRFGEFQRGAGALDARCRFSFLLRPSTCLLFCQQLPESF